MGGWIKLHRQLLEWEWYDDINVCRLFIHCLLKANHADNKWKGKLIKRGQFITSLDKLVSETGLSKSQIRTCLKKLKSTHEIAHETTSQHTVITIENYDSYQGDDTRDSTPVTHESHTDSTQIASNKNDKNDNKKKNRTVFEKPDAIKVQDYFELKGYVSAGFGQRFVDYYESIGWMIGRNKMKDWKRAVSTWITRAASEGKPYPNKNKETNAHQQAEVSGDDMAALMEKMK